MLSHLGKSPTPPGRMSTIWKPNSHHHHQCTKSTIENPISCRWAFIINFVLCASSSSLCSNIINQFSMRSRNSSSSFSHVEHINCFGKGRKKNVELSYWNMEHVDLSDFWITCKFKIIFSSCNPRSTRESRNSNWKI